MQRIGDLKAFLRKRRRDIAIVTLWTVILVLLMIKTHQSFYWASERFQRGIPYLQHVGPRFDGFDITIIIIVGFFAGFFLIDVKNVVYGYFTSMLSATITSTLYVFIYIWTVLGWGAFWAGAQIDFGWEYSLFQAFLNVTRFMFPIGIGFSLVAVISGSLIRNWVSYF